MPARKRRSAPTYLVLRRDRWHGRFRHRDSLGAVNWPCEVSPAPSNYAASLAWVGSWRLEWIRAHEAALRELEAERRRPLTLGELLAAYEADCRERGTRWDREGSRAKWLLATLGAETPYSDLTPVRVVDWRASLRERRHLSPRSANAYLALLQAALNLAVTRGLIPDNPLRRRVGRLPEAPRTPEALSVRQVAALVAALDDYEAKAAAGEASRAQAARKRNPTRLSPVPLRGIVLACYLTMARTGNVLALRWRDVDLEREQLTFPRTKTGRRLVVPMRAALAEHLRAIRPGPDAASYVWPNPRTGRPYTDVARAWRRLIAIANAALAPRDQIPPEQRLYSLRHSGISHLLLAGVRPQVVAQLAGNSLRMIERHYAHLHDEELRQALAAADADALVSKVVSTEGPKPPQLPPPSDASGVN